MASPNPRTVTEILKRSLTIRFATSIAAGHMTTLQNQNRRAQAYYLLGFLVLPSFPIASLIINIGRSVQSARHHNGSLSYYASSVLGLYAEGPRNPNATDNLDREEQEDPKTWNIVYFDVSLLKCHRQRHDWRWVARFAVLLYYVTQVSGALSTAHNRWRKGLAYVGTFDGWDALYLLGGFCVGLQSLVIHACNWKWRFPHHPPAAMQYDAKSNEPTAKYLQISTRRRLLPMSLIFEEELALLISLFYFLPAWQTYRDIMFPLWKGAMLEGVSGALRLIPMVNMSSQIAIGFHLTFLLAMPILGFVLSQRGWIRQWTWIRWFHFNWLIATYLTLATMAYATMVDLMDLNSCFLRCEKLAWKDPREDGGWGL